MNLCRLEPGTTCQLASIGGTGGFRRRLLEMGFLPGTTLRLVRRIDVGGVLEVELRGCRVSIRTADAESIQILAL